MLVFEQSGVRLMERGDIPRVVVIHKAAFPGFFLSSLGDSFLGIYYECVRAGPTGIALVSEQDGQITGFAVGMVKPSGFYKRAFLKQAWRFALALVDPVFRHPLILARVALRLPMVAGAAYASEEALLASIAVDPTVQSKGTGGMLVDRFLLEAKAKGANAVTLTTQAWDNEGANRFYQRHGFTCRRTLLIAEGRRMNEYWRTV